MNKEKRRILLPWWVPYSIPVALFAIIMVLILTDKPEYTVRFSSGYDGGKDSTQTVERNDTVPVPGDLYRHDYTFKGWWYRDTDGWRPWDFENDRVCEDITLTAFWERVTFTFYLDPNGGECDCTEYQVYQNVKYQLPVPQREGYTFAGWFHNGRNLTKGIYPYTKTDTVTVKARWVTYPLGMTVKIGRFEQDGNLANGPEEIEWYVVDYKDGKYYLLSKYLLSEMRYSKDLDSTDWETSLIRAYLNDEFFDTAFTEQEQQYIVPTALPEGVTDRVFLLSKDDVEQTVVDGLLTMGIPSDDLLAQGVKARNRYYDFMHDDTEYQTTWYYMRDSMEVDGCDYRNSNSRSLVRPVMWIDEAYVNEINPEKGEKP